MLMATDLRTYSAQNWDAISQQDTPTLTKPVGRHTKNVSFSQLLLFVCETMQRIHAMPQVTYLFQIRSVHLLWLTSGTISFGTEYCRQMGSIVGFKSRCVVQSPSWPFLSSCRHMLGQYLRFVLQQLRSTSFQFIIHSNTRFSLTLRDERRLSVFENRVLRRVFGPKRVQVTGERRKLHKEELSDLYPLPNIVRVVKSRRIRWEGNVARMGEGRDVHRVLVEKPKGKRTLGNTQTQMGG